MQSSKLKEAMALRDSYKTEWEQESFSSGYDHAHGIACHNVPTIGETYWTDGEGYVTPHDASEAADLHRNMCFEAEMHARCYSPWEHTAKAINDSPNPEASWEAYDAGVSAAIDHDLDGYQYD